MKRLLEWKQRMLQSPLTRKAASPKPSAQARLEAGGPRRAGRYCSSEDDDGERPFLYKRNWDPGIM